jgi:hypothetical protein
MICLVRARTPVRRQGLVVWLMAGVLLLAAGPAVRAAEVHPWCMIYQDMSGATACYYDNYQQCRTAAAGGNSSICTENPAFRAGVGAETSAKPQARRPTR